jgi:DNA-binding MarR family transcriptional regulator
MRKLTDQQVMVLAAIERRGVCMLAELRRELPMFGVGAIFRYLDELELRGLVASQGSPERYSAVSNPRDAGLLGPLPAWD